MKKDNVTYKIHARVTREIEITEEEAELLVNIMCDEASPDDAESILSRFTEGIETGGYEAGYIPGEWLADDLADLLEDEEYSSDDIDL